MRKSFVAALAFAGALLAAPALAADKAGAPAIMPDLTPVASSASCYIQAMAGGSIVAANPDASLLPASISAQSWSADLGFGCDVKFNRVVIGALGRVGAPIDTSGSLIDMDLSWMAAVRAGYLLNTGLMAYGLVGYESNDFSLAGVDLTKDGLVVGGGLEIMLSEHLSLTTEYTYSGFGKTDALGPTLDTDQHKVRVGISYRFGTLFGD